MSEPDRPATTKAIRQHRYRAPRGATELLVVRHGESAPHVPGAGFALVDGQGDPDLAPEGREQAERIAERLVWAGIDAVYVTTLRRTRQTAEPLLRRIGLEARVEADLREVHLGDWEGGVFRERVAAGDPIFLQVLREERWDAIPNAEPMDAFQARVRAGVERIAAAHPDQRVAVFTHGGVVGEILRAATGSRPFAFTGADNGSISHVVVEGRTWVVRRYNDTAHLEDGFTLRPQPVT